MKKFITENFTLIVFILLLLGGLKSCSDSRRLDKIVKENHSIKSEIQAIKDSTHTKSEQNLWWQYWALDAEKRMIQATDRKMWDVQRQNEIEKTQKDIINKLEKRGYN